MEKVYMEEKMNKKTNKKGKLTASQRLEAIEQLIMTQNSKFDVVGDEIDTLREAIGALAKRVNATIQAAEQGGVTNSSVNQIVINETAKDLGKKVKFLTDQGVLVTDNGSPISEKSFVVGRELDDDSNEVNPRVQFAVGSLDGNLNRQIIGHKLGDVFKLEGAETNLEIMEVYSIQNPNSKDFGEDEDKTSVEA